MSLLPRAATFPDGLGVLLVRKWRRVLLLQLEVLARGGAGPSASAGPPLPEKTLAKTAGQSVVGWGWGLLGSVGALLTGKAPASFLSHEHNLGSLWEFPFLPPTVKFDFIFLKQMY